MVKFSCLCKDAGGCILSKLKFTKWMISDACQERIAILDYTMPWSEWFLTPPWACNFNHAPQSSQYLMRSVKTLSHVANCKIKFWSHFNPNTFAGLVGKVRKKISRRMKERRVEKKTRAARPPGPRLKPGTCRMLGEVPQLHARGAV